MLDNKRIIEIYNLYNRELYIYIFRYINANEASEDILHDCFENFIKYSITHGIDDLNIRAFLYKTAHNLCVNYLKRHAKIDYVPLEDDGIAYSAASASESVEIDELNNKIYELIQKMDEKSISIFIMKKELDLDYHEIARNLGISERTVRRKMVNILEYLSDSLKKSGFMSIFLIIMTIIIV